MGLEDLANQAKGLLHSDKAEEISDNLLDSASAAADKVTGGKFADQIDGARDAADEHVGNE